MEKLHILAIAVHPDDIELGCAGTLINHSRKGQAVGILDLTRGELGTRGTPELRLEEAAAAAKVMGAIVRENAGMRDGFFRNDEEHQLQLVRYIRRWQPDVVLTNALHDRHPDHGRAGRLVADACFLAGLRKISTTWNDLEQEAWRPKRVFHFNQDFQHQPTILVDVTENYAAKMASIMCYQSQFTNANKDEPETYISSKGFTDQIMHRDSLNGKLIGVQYAEAFVCENLPGITDLDQLIYPQMP